MILRPTFQRRVLQESIAFASGRGKRQFSDAFERVKVVANGKFRERFTGPTAPGSMLSFGLAGENVFRLFTS
jgi:hypothetical protein